MDPGGVAQAPLAERAKLYASMCLGTSAALSAFAFLFLIPFVVEPAVSSVLADFAPEPGTCEMAHYEYAQGLKNCTWASCREGCTAAHARCHRLRVRVSRSPFEGESAREPSDWEEAEFHFLVNPEGCGYPPYVNCSEWVRAYAGTEAPRRFPCYHSRARPELVVSRHAADDAARRLALAVMGPFSIAFGSLALLAYWHCQCCRRRRRPTRKRPGKEDELLCAVDDEPDDDGDETY